jgi:hypothetical protein
MKTKIQVKVGEGYNIRLPRTIVKQMGLTENQMIAVIPAGYKFSILQKNPDEEIPAMIVNLSSVNIADLFSFLNMTQRTGMLVVIPESFLSTSVYFSNGDVVYAFSEDRNFKIGQILYKLGYINEEELRIAEEEVKEGGKFGSILLKKGFITTKELWAGLRYQMEEIIYNLFSLKSGISFFIDGVKVDPELAQISLSTQNLLMEGFRRMDEWTVIKEKIKGPDVILELSPNPPPIKVSDTVKKVLETIDGKTSISEIIRKTRLGEFGTYKILFQLLKLGVINVLGEPVQTKSEEVIKWEEKIEKYNKCFKDVVSIFKKKIDGFDLKKHLDDFKKSLSERMKKVFQDVEIDDSGWVPPSKLAENVRNLLLEESDEITKVGGLLNILGDQFVIEAMNELLNFLQFLGRNLLDEDSYKEVVRLVEEIRKG